MLGSQSRAAVKTAAPTHDGCARPAVWDSGNGFSSYVQISCREQSDDGCHGSCLVWQFWEGRKRKNVEQRKDGVTNVTGHRHWCGKEEECTHLWRRACYTPARPAWFPGCHPLSGPPKAIHSVLERTLWVPVVKIFQRTHQRKNIMKDLILLHPLARFQSATVNAGSSRTNLSAPHPTKPPITTK